MTDNKSSEGRRKLLKSIAAGSGAVIAGKSLPDSWSRPVVDSVMLPAHALTSGTTYSGVAEIIEFVSVDREENMFAGISDTLIPEAHAISPGAVRGSLCATTYAEGVDVWYQNNKNTVLRRGMIPLQGEGMLEVVDTNGDPSCNDRPALPAEIVDIATKHIDILIKHQGCGCGGDAIYRTYIRSGCVLPELDSTESCSP